MAHHGLIKLIVEDALNNIRNPMLWSIFIDMDKETLMGTQNIIPGDTHASSLGDRDTRIEEEDDEKKK